MFEVFDRERFLVAHRQKMLPIILRIRLRIRRNILHYGPTYPERLRKHVRDSNVAIMAGCLRPILRERAKQVMYDALKLYHEKLFMLAVFKKYLNQTIMIQRVLKLRYKIFFAKKVSFDKKYQEVAKAANGLRLFIVAVFISNVKSQKEIIR